MRIKVKELKYGKLIFALLHLDVALILVYLAFRSEILILIFRVNSEILNIHLDTRYQFLLWGFIIFFTCAASSFARKILFSEKINYMSGLVFFEIMILLAVTLNTWSVISTSAEIDSFWILSLSFPSYAYEVITTAGCGYVFSDLLFRVLSFFINR